MVPAFFHCAARVLVGKRSGVFGSVLPDVRIPARVVNRSLAISTRRMGWNYDRVFIHRADRATDYRKVEMMRWNEWQIAGTIIAFALFLILMQTL